MGNEYGSKTTAATRQRLDLETPKRLSNLLRVEQQRSVTAGAGRRRVSRIVMFRTACGAGRRCHREGPFPEESGNPPPAPGRNAG